MKIIAISLFIYFGLLIILYLFQERVIFFPDDRTCPELKSVSFNNDTIRFIEKIHPNPRATLIHFHGNAGSVCDRDFMLHYLHEIPLNIILVEYPGYSGDPNFPTLKRIKEYSINVVNFFKKDKIPIFLYGESLGTVISTHLASFEKIEGLILQSPFGSLGEVGQNAYPIFPVKWLVKNDFKSQSITTRTLILIGENDDIVPKEISNGQIKFFENSKVITFKNRGHNDLVVDNKKLWSEITSFLLLQ